MPRYVKRSQGQPSAPSRLFEAETLIGLEPFAHDEIKTLQGTSRTQVVKGAVRFRYSGGLRQLRTLSLAQAVYRVEHFAVPRPKALLGDANLRVLVNMIDEMRRNAPDGSFSTLHIAAAGSDSSVMRRLLETLATALGMQVDTEEGDLVIRLRPTHDDDPPGWEALVRLTARPLATRDWRVCNLEGALNATAARAMALLTKPTPTDRVINLGAGSGTLMIERLQAQSSQTLLGIDNDSTALACAVENLTAARVPLPFSIVHGDMIRTPFSASAFDVLLADLPFGQAIGSHRENRTLYPAILAEAARVAQSGARFVLITHEIRLIEMAMREQPLWRLQRTLPIVLRGLHPRIYVLERV